MATIDYYGEEMETGIPVDELAFETMIRRCPPLPPLSTVEVEEHVQRLAAKVFGGDDADTDTEPGPEEGDDGDGNGG